MISFIFAIVSFVNGLVSGDIRFIFASIGFCFTGVLAEYVFLKVRKERKN